MPVRPSDVKEECTATLSECGTYRYSLTRKWGDGEGLICWVLLNPSTADASRDDPTVRRVRGFSKSFGFDGFVLVNLFAYRSTDPKGLLRAADPVGEENDLHIRRAAERGFRTVLAWGKGVPKRRRLRIRDVLAILGGIGVAPYCLGTTADGTPRHPLMLRTDTPLVPWPPRLGGGEGT